MCGGRDRDEFSQPLDNAEEEGVEDGHGDSWRVVTGSFDFNHFL
jgi:hypothetical protein